MKKPVRTAVSTKPVRGAPTLYKAEYAMQAYKLCLLGATNPDVAKFFGVSLQTVEGWIQRIPVFHMALKEGRVEADANVGKRLYERAMGYSHPEEKIFCNADGDVTRVDTTKHYPPDTTAMIFWLKNRRPDLWRDRQEFTGANGAALPAPPPLVINFYGSKRPGDDAKLIEARTAHR